MVKKIGLLGGTFNPPHNGHLMMAQVALKALQLDEIRFMPNAVPPHKAQNMAATDAQRVAMVQAMIAPYTNFTLEPYEITKGGISYSYATMRVLCAREPEVQFYFIIGGDMIASLDTWQNIDELLTMVKFVGLRRPGTVAQTPYPIILLDAPEMAISSTAIRQAIASEEPVAQWLPEAVQQVITKEGLYDKNTIT